MNESHSTWLSLALAILLMVASASFAQGSGTSPKPFGVGVRDGVWWMLRPDGTPFWSFGVDCVAPGSDWRTIDLGNPSYAAFRLFPDSKAWVDSTLDRLRDWGFNTIGGWADVELLRKHAGERALPYAVVLHLGAYDKAPWHDLFGVSMRRAIEQAAKDQIVPLLDDPNLIGYFTDNELGWWDDTLFLSYLEMPASAPGKRRLVRLIREHYRDRWTALQEDWSTPDARGFDELEARSKMCLRPGGQGMRLVNAWSYVLADQYYRLVKQAIRRYDPTRLILGDRFIQYYSLPIARACGRHMDVVSTNLGADWNDGGVSRFFLEALYEETRKPILITEFYMAAMENRSGNKNTGTAFPVVATQRERAASFERNVREYAWIPWVVGAHWFQFHDEPTFGRHDGEDFNMGLVDIHGEPYEGLVAAAKGLDVSKIHHAAVARSMPTERLVVPTAREKPFVPSLRDWPRDEGYVPPKSAKGSFADMYVCRDAGHLYLGLYAMDFADERLYEGSKMPESERAVWEIRLGSATPTVRVRFMGEKRAPTVEPPSFDVVESSGVKRTLVLRVPLERLRMDGHEARLRCSLASHSRAEAMEWDARIALPPN